MHSNERQSTLPFGFKVDTNISLMGGSLVFVCSVSQTQLLPYLDFLFILLYVT